VGEVYIGVACAGGWGTGETHLKVERHNFDGSRWEIREKIAGQALRSVYEETKTG